MKKVVQVQWTWKMVNPQVNRSTEQPVDLIQVDSAHSSYLGIVLKVTWDCMTHNTTEWTKEAKIPDCSTLWFFFFILDQESCSDSNGGCTHQCIQGPYGAQCQCPLGYLLANDSKTCEDIDECRIPGFCSQHCYNTRGSFRCWCDPEYRLDADQRTCKATGNESELTPASLPSTLQSLRLNVTFNKFHHLYIMLNEFNSTSINSVSTTWKYLYYVLGYCFGCFKSDQKVTT